MENLLKKSLSIQIYEHLKNDIILQNIPAGSKLIIKEIQNKFNVSSTPVRDALSLLAKENLVTIVVNQGAKVCDFDLCESLAIHELNIMLDLYAVEKAMKGAKHLEIANKLKNVIDLHSKMNESASITQQINFDTLFHNVFYEYIENSDIANIRNLYLSRFQVIVFQAFNFLSCSNRIIEHTLIHDAVRDNNVEKAVELMRVHYQNGAVNITSFFANKEANTTTC